MPQTWNDFTTVYRSKLLRNVSDTIMSKTSDVEEVVSFLSGTVQMIARDSGFPIAQSLITALQAVVPSAAVGLVGEEQAKKLLDNLGDMRQRAISHHSQSHLARISFNALDQAVVHSGISWEAVRSSQYNMGRIAFDKVSKQEPRHGTLAGEARVGRKSKINDEKVICYVRLLLQKYTNDSSKVVVVRKNGAKQLVCARLLTRKLQRIWQEEPDLRKQLGITALRRMMKVHFPSIPKPGRKTDVCSHCRIFKKHILPRAEREYKKRRSLLLGIAPDYFQAFDADSHIVQLKESARIGDVIVRAAQYINSKNASSQTQNDRQSMSRTARIDLFQAEAKACHKLKGHCELLEAYAWHKQSADRQREFAKDLLENLPKNEAYMHFDFKENVRYPMAKEETGQEFHAQNKLSLTVFGCMVCTPGRRNFNFLLVSEVLDHDSQIARLLLSKVLDVVRNRPAYEWSKVQRLHLVCDCGPHFRSRESYAFYLHDLPKELKLPVPCLNKHCVFFYISFQVGAS